MAKKRLPDSPLALLPVYGPASSNLLANSKPSTAHKKKPIASHNQQYQNAFGRASSLERNAARVGVSRNLLTDWLIGRFPVPKSKRDLVIAILNERIADAQEVISKLRVESEGVKHNPINDEWARQKRGEGSLSTEL